LGTVILLSLTSAANPTLIAATTVMLLLPNPKRLMLGYLLGALMTSITLGLVIVFALEETQSVNTTQRTVSPAVDIALGVMAIVLALVLSSARADRALQWRRERRETHPKGPPRWQRELSKGSPRVTFVLGALLTLPGASYLAGLHALSKLDYPTAVVVLVVVGFNLVMLALIEVPLLCFTFAPEWTPGAVARAKAWIGEHIRIIAIRGFTILGAALVLKGVIGLLR